MKPQIIILDGIDKVGKTTLQRELQRQCNYNHWFIDRGPLSHVCYNLIYNRCEQNEEMDNIDMACEEAILVYVTANNNLVKRRIACSPNEPDNINVERDASTFNILFHATRFRYKASIEVDTSEDSPETSARKIINQLEELLDNPEFLP